MGMYKEPHSTRNLHRASIARAREVPWTTNGMSTSCECFYRLGT